MIWFSADYHLSHKNIIHYCNRPFKTVKEMDNEILVNLFRSMGSGDTLYYLGDLTFKIPIAKSFFASIQNSDIKIHYIIGNHDKPEVIELARLNCDSVSNLKDIKLEEKPITLCHYAMRVWNKSHFNSWQLYGHSHGALAPIGKQYDVGVDNNEFKPVSFEDLKIIMENLPNNFNYIENVQNRQ